MSEQKNNKKKQNSPNPKGEKRGPKGPSKELSDKDFSALVEMIKIQCTAREICGVLGMSEDTLSRRIRERGIDGVGNFAELYRQHQSEGMVSLRRAQWKSAIEKGNVVMQKFLGAQVLGQSEKKEVSGPNGDAIPVSIVRTIIDPKE